MTFAERLDYAIKLRGFKVKAFVREMQALGADESYSTVRRYVDPDSGNSPRLEWLVIASELLRIRLGWLVAGEGIATKEDFDGASKLANRIVAMIGDSDAPIPD